MTASAALQPDTAIFPMLTEMGVLRFHEISHYTLRQDGPKNDVLKVHYKRRKGSLLPVARKYAFGRSMKTVVADGGSSRLEDTFEISPYLLDALAELDRLVEANRLVPAGQRHDRDAKGRLIDDLDALRIDIVDALPETERARLSSKLYEIERRLEAL